MKTLGIEDKSCAKGANVYRFLHLTTSKLIYIILSSVTYCSCNSATSPLSHSSLPPIIRPRTVAPVLRFGTGTINQLYSYYFYKQNVLTGLFFVNHPTKQKLIKTAKFYFFRYLHSLPIVTIWQPIKEL